MDQATGPWLYFGKNQLRQNTVSKLDLFTVTGDRGRVLARIDKPAIADAVRAELGGGTLDPADFVSYAEVADLRRKGESPNQIANLFGYEGISTPFYDGGGAQLFEAQMLAQRGVLDSDAVAGLRELRAQQASAAEAAAQQVSDAWQTRSVEPSVRFAPRFPPVPVDDVPPMAIHADPAATQSMTAPVEAHTPATHVMSPSPAPMAAEPIAQAVAVQEPVPVPVEGAVHPITGPTVDDSFGGFADDPGRQPPPSHVTAAGSAPAVAADPAPTAEPAPAVAADAAPVAEPRRSPGFAGEAADAPLWSAGGASEPGPAMAAPTEVLNAVERTQTEALTAAQRTQTEALGRPSTAATATTQVTFVDPIAPVADTAVHGLAGASPAPAAAAAGGAMRLGRAAGALAFAAPIAVGAALGTKGEAGTTLAVAGGATSAVVGATLVAVGPAGLKVAGKGLVVGGIFAALPRLIANDEEKTA